MAVEDGGAVFGERLRLLRRYSAFGRLAEGVRACLPPSLAQRMPPMPPKTLFPPRVGSAALRTRMRGLQRLLAFLVDLRGADQAPRAAAHLFDAFFDLHGERAARLARAEDLRHAPGGAELREALSGGRRCAARPSGGGKALRILDARARLSAVANAIVKGKGFERLGAIGGEVELSFADIGNIHVMRASLRALGRAAAEADGGGGLLGTRHALGVAHITHRRGGAAQREEEGGGGEEGSRGRKLAGAGAEWLSHAALLLQAANWGADALDGGHALLVHCSDGWDRTAQIVALTQLLLDARYRSLEGFGELLRAAWCAFGHRFRSRLRGGLGGSDASQRSPIFLQFVDAVAQLCRQFPSSFEFTPRYLELLLAAAYSGAFLEFAEDCEGSRAARDRRPAATLEEFGWPPRPGAYDVPCLPLLEERARRRPELVLLNPLYEGGGGGRLTAACDPNALVLWRDYHLRHSAANAMARLVGLTAEEALLEAAARGARPGE